MASAPSINHQQASADPWGHPRPPQESGSRMPKLDSRRASIKLSVKIAAVRPIHACQARSRQRLITTEVALLRGR